MIEPIAVGERVIVVTGRARKRPRPESPVVLTDMHTVRERRIYSIDRARDRAKAFEAAGRSGYADRDRGLADLGLPEQDAPGHSSSR